MEPEGIPSSTSYLCLRDSFPTNISDKFRNHTKRSPCSPTFSYSVWWQYLVASTNYKALHYEIFSSLFLLTLKARKNALGTLLSDTLTFLSLLDRASSW